MSSVRSFVASSLCRPLKQSPRGGSLIADAFVCRRCLQTRTQPLPYQSVRQTPFLSAFRRQVLVPSRKQTSGPSAAKSVSWATVDDTKASIVVDAARASKASSWPQTSSRSVAYWLLGSAVSVFGIVIFGGLTRLTESGLSITEWRPVTGSFPPLDEEAWEREFALYRQSPEFKMLNSRMTRDEFKQIYWMEWTHRLWGRVVGITFLLPTVYFVARKRVTLPMATRLIGICGLIGFQGLIGWWMVKSGLKDDLLETGKHPRVSQYRLAAHLGTAFVAYLAMLWNGLHILREHKLLQNPSAGLQLLETLKSSKLKAFRLSIAGLSILIFFTAMSGALVAGLDAGLIYNDFPWMGQRWVPPTEELFDPFYAHAPSQKDIYWRNALENPVLVQLDHRILAVTTFTAVMVLWGYSRFSSTVKSTLPRAAKAGMLGVVHLVSVQVALGITTLWYLVPTPLGAAHQAGALALLTGVFILGSRLVVPKRTLSLVRQALSQSSAKSPSAMANRKL